MGREQKTDLFVLLHRARARTYWIV
jgi:hypothetical protein